MLRVVRRVVEKVGEGLAARLRTAKAQNVIGKFLKKHHSPGLNIVAAIIAVATGGVVLTKAAEQNTWHEIAQYPANNPCEDTFSTHELTIGGQQLGHYAAVFDGHGGWQVAEYARNNLHLYLEQELSSRHQQHKHDLTEEDYKAAIEAAFDRVEKELLNFTNTAYETGYPQTAYVGACALVSVVTGDKLYIANAGDCRAVLIHETGPSQFEAIKMSTVFSANKAAEQERLKQQFGNENDIVMCKAKNACYVKGNLMPTRSFGDFHLKYKQFNEWDKSAYPRYRAPIQEFTGPYITHKPEIRVHTVGPQDLYLVLASDGLWDEVSAQQVAGVVGTGKESKRNITEILMAAALTQISHRTGLSLSDITTGNFRYPRRMIHDDITIIAVPLKA